MPTYVKGMNMNMCYLYAYILYSIYFFNVQILIYFINNNNNYVYHNNIPLIITYNSIYECLIDTLII